MKIKYQAYISGQGWQPEVENGMIAGTVGEHKAIEAVRITALEGLPEGTNLGVTGIAHVQDIGWGNDSPTGTDIGSTGLNKHLEAIKLNVFGESASDYEVWYHLHVENLGFLNWCRNGEPNGTEGGNLQAEAIQIFLRNKNENFWPAVDTTIPFEKIQKEIEQPRPSAEESIAEKRKRIIDTAAAHIGESGLEFQNRMGIQNQPWCAAFASCVFIDCGFKELIPITVSVPTMQDWAIENGKWHPAGSGYQPQSADLIIYDFNGNGTGDHVGIVHSSNGFNDTNAVEGNTGSPRQVMMRHRIEYILGYISTL